MDKLNTSTRKLKLILKDRWFQVPSYQRPYQWTSFQIETLIDDLVDPYQSNINLYTESGMNGWHPKPSFCGSIIFIDSNKDPEKKLTERVWNPGNNKPLSIVDGQQRTITFYLIIFALIYKTLELKKRFEDVEDNFFISKLAPSFLSLLEDLYDELFEYVSIEIDPKEPAWKKDGEQDVSYAEDFENWHRAAKSTNRLFREEDDPLKNKFSSELSTFLQLFIYQSDNKIKYSCDDGPSRIASHLKSIESLVKNICNQKSGSDFNEDLLNDVFYKNYETIVKHLEEKLFDINIQRSFAKKYKDPRKFGNLCAAYCDHLEINLRDLRDETKQLEIINYFKKTNSSIGVIISEFFHLRTFCGNLINDVYFSEIICTDEDLALEIFTALNTTGIPLTVLETFKPIVYEVARTMDTEHKLRPVNSDIIKQYDKIQNDYLNGTRVNGIDYSKINRSDHNSEIKGLLTSFHHYWKTHLPVRADGSEREQRKFLKEVLNDEKSYEDKINFLKEIFELAHFKRRYWNRKIRCGQKNFYTDVHTSNEAYFFIRMLKEASFELVIPIIHKFEQDYIHSPRDNKDHAQDRLNNNIITLALFTLYYRICHESTSGIDDIFRNLMEQLQINYKSVRNGKFTENNELRKFLFSRLEGNNIDTFNAWYSLVESKNLYKGKQNKIFLKTMHRVVSKYSKIDAEYDKSTEKYNYCRLLFSDKTDESQEEIHFADLYSHKLNSIEHLYPISKKESTVDELEWKWLDSIGNLSTLPISINSSLQDNDYKHKELIFRAYSEKTPNIERKEAAKQLKAEGVTITETIKLVIKGDLKIGGRSSLTTHEILGKECPKNIEDIKERGKNICEVFHDIILLHLKPKSE